MPHRPRKDSSGGLSLSEEEIRERKLWLKLSVEDETLLKTQIDKFLDGRVGELMDLMYEHFLSFEKTRYFFPNEQVLNRAKSAQAVYFERLTKGDYDGAYVSDRLRVGSTHHRIDLDPKWYLGAYNSALGFIIPQMLSEHLNAQQSEAVMKPLSALLKIIFFDMGLAIESYIVAKEQAIRDQRDALRELETEKRVTKNILESAPIGIVSMNSEMVCVECNDEFLQIVNQTSRDEVIGQKLFDLAPHLKRSVIEDVLQSEQPRRKTADPLILSDSSLKDVTYWDWAAWPVKDDSGSISGLVAMFSNATDRVYLQQQREDFVATLTHDLKTPVSATNRAVKFFLDGDFGPVSEEQKEILETILQSNTALYSLVQTLLDVYRFDSGVKELNIRSCSLEPMMSQLISEIMPLAQEKGVNLSLNLAANLQESNCDEVEVRRLLQNLIDNSLKFTPHGGSIDVLVEQSDGKTRFSVKDTGKGVPEENKPKLFQRFWQAGSTGRYYASTGLGLYLCRRIVEAHGGRIWCESAVGKGSTFFFEI